MKLILDNFLSFKHVEVDFTSYNGLILVEGINQDGQGATSNGAGKSGLWEGLLWTCFGQTCRGLRYDELIHWGAVDCTGRVVGEDWAIERVRGKKNSVTFYQEGVAVETSSMSHTDQLIQQFLGTNFTGFTVSTVFGQDFISFADLTDAERRKVLSEICNLSAYDAAQARAVVEEKKSEQDLVSYNSQLEVLSGQLETSQVAELEGKLKIWETEQLDKISEAKKQCSLSINEHAKLSYRHQEDKIKCQSEIVEKQASISDQVEKEKERDSLGEKKEGIGAEIRTLEGHLSVHKQNVTRSESSKSLLQETQVSYDSICEQLEQERQPVGDVFDFATNPTIVNLRGELKETRELKEQAVKNQTVAQTKYDERLTAIYKLKSSSGGVCPNCQQEVTKAHVEICSANLQVEVEEFLQVINELDIVIGQAQSTEDDYVLKMNEVTSAINNCNGLIAERDNLAKGLERCKAEISVLETSISEVAKFEEQIKEKEQEKGSIVALIEKISVVLSAYSKVAEEIAGLRVTYESLVDFDYSIYKQSIKQQERAVKMLEEADNPFVDLLAKEKLRVADINQQVAELEGWIGQVESSLSYVKFWVTGFKRLKLFVFDSLIPELSTFTNEYLQFLSDGSMVASYDIQAVLKSGNTSDKFCLNINIDGHLIPFNGLSGGQQRKVRIACNLGLSALAQARSPYNPPFLVFDEPLTGLDEVGRLRVFELLQSLSTKYPAIFVIDHNAEFKDGFSQVMTVERKNQVSVVK